LILKYFTPIFYIYFAIDIESAENITESGVSAGYLEVRPGKQIELKHLLIVPNHQKIILVNL
jgi:hypothetical protein